MKKVRFWFPLYCLVLFAGCSGFGRLIKVSKDISIDFLDGRYTPFELTENYIVIKTFIGDKECDFIFDSGAPSVIFEKDENEWVGELEEIAQLRRLKGADGTKVTNTIVSIPKASTGFFEAHDWLVRKIPWKRECDFKDGIIGQDVLDVNRKKLLVDFDKRIIKTIDEIEDPASWSTFNVKIKNGYINVFIEINDHVYRFKFDTGYSGSLILKDIPTASYQDLNTFFSEKRYGLLFYAAGGFVKDTLTSYLIDRIQLNDDLSISNALLSTCPKISENLMGMKFIQNFNFIIDYEEERVLLKPRTSKYIVEEEAASDLGIGIMVHKGALIVNSLTVSGPAEKAGISINDEILTINGTEIGTIDPCSKKAMFQLKIRYDGKNEILLKREGQILKKTIEDY